MLILSYLHKQLRLVLTMRNIVAAVSLSLLCYAYIGFHQYHTASHVLLQETLFEEDLVRKPLPDSNEDVNPDLLFSPERASPSSHNQTNSPILVPEVKIQPVSCLKLFQGDKKEVKKADAYHSNYTRLVHGTDYMINRTADCTAFLHERRYILDSLTPEEEEFPLAYSIIIYKTLEQVETLLRAIYRPQNLYCIHVDASTASSFQAAAKSLADCFPNVFLAENPVKVNWGTWSVVECELVCMKQLLAKGKKWKYFINLTGQEFPFKTNLELVRILKAFNGSNMITGSVKHRMPWRTTNQYLGRRRTGLKNPPPPVNVTLSKGPVHIIAKRQYVEYLLYNKRALALAKWFHTTSIPDEGYFSSLNHSPQLGVPGAYKGVVECTNEYPMLQRFKYLAHQCKHHKCHGKKVRNMCVYGVGDLVDMYKAPQLFANKFYMNYQPLVLDCLEEYLYNRTKAEVMGKRDYNASWYSKFEFTWNHI